MIKSMLLININIIQDIYAHNTYKNRKWICLIFEVRSKNSRNGRLLHAGSVGGEISYLEVSSTNKESTQASAINFRYCRP